jgi:hypothetical protein
MLSLRWELKVGQGNATPYSSFDQAKLLLLLLLLLLLFFYYYCCYFLM